MSASRVAIAFLCLLFARTVAGQIVGADLVGRVIDESGAVLPAARVTVESIETGDVRMTLTNATGSYGFNRLAPGPYVVRVDVPSFAPGASSVVLATGDRTRIDFKLPLQPTSQFVVVSPEASPLETETSTVSALLTERAVRDLPLNGRNFVSLVQTVPGAHPGLPNSLASGTRPDDRRSSSAVSFNGALDNQNNHLIDGADNNERSIGTIGVKPSIEAIAEIRVQTALYSADVGRTAGGVVNVITKAGTNELHAAGFGFVRNGRFDARDYFATDPPRLRQQQFGGSLSGPLVRRRTFLFTDFEGFRHESDVVNVATVPTLAMRRGDFSEIAAPIFDSSTAPRAPFPDNQIPAARFDPIAIGYLGLYPEPTDPGLANNFRGVRQRTQDANTADVRVDHRWTAQGTVYVRYSWNRIDTFTPGVLPPSGGIEPGGFIWAFAGPNTGTVHAVDGNQLVVLTPKTLVEVRTGYTKLDMRSLPLNHGTNAADLMGLANANLGPNSSHLTPMVPSGYASAGDGVYIPLLLTNDAVRLSGTVLTSRREHDIKLGGGFISRRFAVFQSALPVGLFSFDQAPTDNGAGVGGHPIASFLLGYPSQVQRSNSLIDPHYHTAEPSVFVQDEWRATPWLSINGGLRYDVFTPLTERQNQLSNLDLRTFEVLVAGRDGVSRTAGVETDKGNVAPRAGVAVTLPHAFVARGGYGLTYFPGLYQSEMLLKNAPFVYTYGPVISGAASGGLPTLALSQGLPTPEAPGITEPTGTYIAVETDFRNTRVHQFSAGVEKDLAGNLLSASFLGSRGRRVAFVVPNINLAPAGPGDVDSRRRLAAQLPGVSAVTLFADDFESTYNGAQFAAHRRYRRGLTLSGHYTVSRSTWTQPTPWDPEVIERFDSDFDVRHRTVASINYELPAGRSWPRAARQFLGAWQINGILSWQSGLPFTISNATPRSNTGGTDRPNEVGDPALDHPTVSRWFATEAFEAQAIDTIGSRTVARNSLHGPPQRRLDVSLFKYVAVGSRARLQLRFEAYNVTNTPSFANPNGQLGGAGFGTISATVGTPRQLQLAARIQF